MPRNINPNAQGPTKAAPPADKRNGYRLSRWTPETTVTITPQGMAALEAADKKADAKRQKGGQ